MNLRVPCLALCLLSIAATGDPCDNGGSTGPSVAPMPAGANGAVCEVSVNTACCGAPNDPCTDDNDCCGGTCSGSNGEGGFGSDTSACAAPANPDCIAALSSRCNTGQCECASDDDCCVVGSVCAAATIPGTSGRRCCLSSGFQCDADADCCSLSCSDSGQCG